MLVFVDVFVVLYLLFGVRSVLGTPGVLFFFTLNFLFSLSLYSSPCFLALCFDVSPLRKQTEVVSQMFHWSETSVTRPNLASR